MNEVHRCKAVTYDPYRRTTVEQCHHVLPCPVHYGEDRTRYADFPDHPLVNIRQAVLDAARHAMAEAADAGDTSSEMINPIADMVVMDLLPWLKPEAFL
jgi:hypothetical protein